MEKSLGGCPRPKNSGIIRFVYITHPKKHNYFCQFQITNRTSSKLEMPFADFLPPSPSPSPYVRLMVAVAQVRSKPSSLSSMLQTRCSVGYETLWSWAGPVLGGLILCLKASTAGAAHLHHWKLGPAAGSTKKAQLETGTSTRKAQLKLGSSD